MDAKRTCEAGAVDGTEHRPIKRPRSGSVVPRGQKKALPKVTKLVAKEPPADRIIVAIDYGTTNSGAAYARANLDDDQNIHVITTWPGTADQLEKVESRIAFAKEHSNWERNRWGRDIPPGAKSYTWTKLLLDSGADKTKFDSDVLTGELRHGLLELPDDMSAEDVAAAFLTEFGSYVMKELEKDYGAKDLSITPIDFWFTVPATWQEAAVAATRSAALRAGFRSRSQDTLSFITEPESAAISILSQATARNSTLINEDEDILVPDLGGGTQDYQTLTLKKKKPNLASEETIPGIAGKFGSTSLDVLFHEYMAKTFGEAFTSLPGSKTGHGTHFMRAWEAKKKAFDGKDLDESEQIPLPALGRALEKLDMTPAEYDFEDHCVLLPRHEIQRCFEPAINAAYGLIDQQLQSLKKLGRSPFKAMCLCGGLGSSPYVYRRFQEYCNDKLDGECEVLKDARPQSSVVRGACIRGLNGNTVLSKKAKRCYGVGVHRPFREGVDDEKKAYWCPAKQQKRARGYVAWFIVFGNPITENMRVKLEVYAQLDDQFTTHCFDLYSCANETPPSTVGPDVKKEGSITVDLRKLPKSQKDFDLSEGEAEALTVDLIAKLGSQKGVIVIECKSGRSSLGTAQIEYASTHARQPRPREAGAL